MENQNQDEIHISDTDANAGETSGHMRWVLGIGTLLAIVLLSIIWMTGAATQGDVEEEATATGIEQSMDSSDSTDSIVSDQFAEDGVGTETADTEVETIEN